MIQRKQTIWLLIVAILALLTIKYSFYTGNIEDALTKVKTYKVINAQTTIMILILTIAIVVTALITIFLYKDRKKQMLLTTVLLVVSLLNIVLNYFQTKPFVDGAYSITAIIVLAIPLFSILATLGIYRDEQLIKSVDRLR